MAARESEMEGGIEAVAIVTPNHMHFLVAREFLRRGIHVISDKPITATLADAEALAELAADSGAFFVLPHNYTGYPMVRHARDMIAAGCLGGIRVVQVEYAQYWLTRAEEGRRNKQAEWRTDPLRSGAGGCIGDIGSHALNLLGFVTWLQVETLSANLSTFVAGRQLDDNAQVFLRFSGGARGMLWSSQVAPGNENALRSRVYGDKDGIDWSQEAPNHLWFTPFGEETRRISRNGAGAGPAATRVSRLPAGHPEGYLESFATINAEAALAIRAHRSGEAAPAEVLYPGVEDGLLGMRFIDACVRSSACNATWVNFT